MKEFFLRFISFLLVAVLAVGSTPISFHHDHHEEEHCSHDGDLQEVSACHISIYHANDKEACEHNTHFSQDEQECSWCSLLLPKRNKYKLPQIQNGGALASVEFEDFSPLGFIQRSAVSPKKGRAPPTV